MACRAARILRSAILSRPIQCSRSIAQSRYATSSSKPDPEAAGSKADRKSKAQDKPPTTAAAAAAAAENPIAAGSKPEVGYTKKPKSQEKPSKAADTPTKADESTGYAKKPKEKTGKAAEPASKAAEVGSSKTPAAAAGSKPDEKDEVVYTKKPKPAEDTKAPEPGEDPTLKSVGESGEVGEVGYKRRVMPLPEDREASGEEPGDTPLKKAMKPETVEKYDLPLPRIIKVEEKKKPAAVGLSEAIQLVKESAHCKFVETVEAHIQLGVDPKRSDQLVRGAVSLPHGSGRLVKVAVFADGAAAEEALAAGADVVGTDELIEKVFASGGKLDFDKCIAVPSVMPKLGKVARILGPRGLMPNPKMGTVTVKVGEAVKAAKKGRVDFRADKAAIVHAGLGKVNFADEALYENIAAFAAAVVGAKPAGFKKSARYSGYFIKFYLCCTMGPGIPVSIQSVAGASDQYMKTQEAAAQALLRSGYDYC